MEQTLIAKVITISVIWISIAFIGTFNKNLNSEHLLTALLLGLISSCVMIGGKL